MEEKYIGNFSIVENEFYKIFKNNIICPLCHNIFFDPMICIKCQSSFCKKCIYKTGKNCPNKCIDFSLMKDLNKEEILKKLEFKYIKNEKIIKYEELKRFIPYQSSLKIEILSNKDSFNLKEKIKDAKNMNSN
jgi:hypothetical protein